MRTARDYLHRHGKTLDESLRILGLIKPDHHIDPDLLEVFIHEKVYLMYAEQFLDAKQIDEVDVTKIPGFATQCTM